MIGVEDSLLNPECIASAKIKEKTDWLGMREGYYIQCKMIDGTTVDVYDECGEYYYSMLEAGEALDEINEVL